MQKHHVMLVIAAVAVSILTKQLFWPAKPDADTQLTNGIDVLQMEQDKNAKNLPGQTIDDRSFVYGNP